MPGTVSILCPECGATYGVSQRMLGKRARCKSCGTAFVITSSDRSPPATTPEVRTLEQTRATEQEVPLVWGVADVILDLYEVKDVHTGGGMGLVYRVHHRGWDMDLAVKSPRPEYLKTEGQKESFERECETWVNLGLHPNIVSCYYVRRLGGIPRVFAEYVEGGSLEDWIRDGRLYEGGPEEALRRILDIAIQFAWGLHYAHERGLVHQDVKPANVMMTPDSIAKVTDFGLARARAVTAEGTAPGDQRGILVSTGGMTPAYCSPEQANRQKLTLKTDTWSWGVSLLEVFAGGVTWPSGTVAPEALELLLEEGAQDESIPRMPEGVAELLRHCFRQEPNERPEGMRVIAERIRCIHERATRVPYFREEPRAAAFLADSLNNRAVSLLDLNRAPEARELYEQALRADAHHPEATYNRGLLLWRSGAMTDVELVDQLQEVRATHEVDWADDYLLGLLHMERSDAESAIPALEEAAKQAPSSSTVRSALDEARAGLQQWGRCLLILPQHAKPVHAVALSGDGRLALSRELDGDLLAWNVVAQQCLWRTGAAALEGSPALSSNGRLVGCGSRYGQVYVWDLGARKLLMDAAMHQDAVYAVRFSPDGRFGLSSSKDTTVRLWETTTGRCVRTLQGHTGPVHSAVLSSDGRLALSGAGESVLGVDNSVRLWDLNTGRCLRVLGGHTGQVVSVALSSDGRLALSGGNDSTLRLWDLRTGQCLRIFRGHQGWVTSVALSGDGRFAVSGSLDQTLRLWAVATGQCLRTYQGHASVVHSVALSSDGHLALTGSSDRTARLWKLVAGSPQREVLCEPRPSAELTDRDRSVSKLQFEAASALESGQAGKAYALIVRAMSVAGYSRAADLLAVRRRAGLAGQVSSLEGAWHRRTCRVPMAGTGRDSVTASIRFEVAGHRAKPPELWEALVRQFAGQPIIRAVALSGDGGLALSGSWDNMVRLWDLSTGTCVRTLEGHQGQVEAVALSPDGRMAISAGYDRTIRTWQVETGTCTQVLEGHRFGVEAVALSPDLRFAVSGSVDGTLRLWELAAGQCLWPFHGHTGNVASVAFAPDGRFVLSGSHDGTAKIWEPASGACLLTLEGHTAPVTSVALSPDGRFAVSGSHDGTLRLWRIRTGQCLRTLPGHAGTVTSAAVFPDGRAALSGGLDKTLRLWSLGTGRCLRVLQGHAEAITAVAMSRDGHLVLSGSEDGTVRSWEVLWGHRFPEPAGWHEGAEPFLQMFLTTHCPYGENGITRVGRANWTDEDLETLLEELRFRGYGWLRPEGVQKKLEEMIATWQGPPPLPGEE